MGGQRVSCSWKNTTGDYISARLWRALNANIKGRTLFCGNGKLLKTEEMSSSEGNVTGE